VLVIGGGATGAGVARDLARRGVDVTLVDRGGLSSGTSGRSHGLLHSGARYAETDPEGAAECLAENRTLRRIAGDCIAGTGGLFVSLSADDGAYFERKLAACGDVGIDAEPLDAAACRRRVPGLSGDVEAGFAVPDGVVYPSRLVAANAADAAAHGATILPHAPVESLAVSGDRIVAAELGGAADRRVAPEYVVNAAGAWADRVAAMAGLEVGVAPSRGVMVALRYEGLAPVLNRCRPPADGDIVVPHDGTVVAGTTSTPVDDPEEFERPSAAVETCIAECAAMLPALASAPTERVWWGLRPLYAPEEAGRDRRGISRGFARIDHTDVGNFVSVVGGKLTTYRLMAESVADLICERLGVGRACTTAEAALPGADDPDRLDAYVRRYDAAGPADGDVVGAKRQAE